MKKYLIFITILIIAGSSLFAFKGVLKDFTENDGATLIDTPYIYYYDAITTNFGGTMDQESAHKGKMYFLQTTGAPGPEGYIASFTCDIDKKDAGEFYLMASMIPMGVAHGSPVEVYLDNEKIFDFVTEPGATETGKKAYGVSSALKWNNFGLVKLTQGEHTFNFVVRKDTALTKGMFVQAYDAFALVKYVPMPKPTWKDCEVPLFYKTNIPPKMPLYSYWAEAEDQANNLAVTNLEGVFGGKQLFLQTDLEHKDNYVDFQINVDKPGKYLIMGAAGPCGAIFVSPMDMYIDDYLIKSFDSCPSASNGWGWSGTLRWVSFGVVDLTADTHSIKFTISKNRAMDKMIIQSIDALALVDCTLLEAKIHVDAKETKYTGKAKDTIHISLNPTITKTNIQSPCELPINMKLMYEGYKIKEYLANVNIDPANINKPLNIEFDMEVPFDITNGNYYLESDSIVSKTHLADFSFTGTYKTEGAKPLCVKGLSLNGGTVKAGEEYKFKVSGNFLEKSNSDIITILFESEKDVAYYAVSVKVPDMLGAKGQWTSQEVSFTLPKTMPKGPVTGLLSLNNDTYESEPVQFNIVSDYTKTTTDLKPMSYGFFKDSTGMTQVWYSNSAHTLFWNGQAFMKVSAMFNGPYMSFSNTEEDFEGFKANVQKIKSQGINHLYLFTQGAIMSLPPDKFQRIMDYLEQEGMTYVVGMPSGDGTKWELLKQRQIRANKNKVVIDKNVTGKHTRTIKGSEFDMGATKICDIRCSAIVGDEVVEIKDATITETGRDFVVCEVDFGNKEVDIAYDVSFLTDWSANNPWKNYKDQYTSVSNYLKVANLRPGFRGFVDMILHNERGMYNAVEPIFVASPEFIKARTLQLTEKYKTIQALKKAWLVKGDFVKTIAEAASLYPVYNNDDVLFLTSETDKSHIIYKLDAKNTPYWYEYLDMRDTSYGDLQDLMIDKVKEVADAPVNIKLCGMPEIYDIPRKSNRLGLDGVGCETYATGEGHITYNVGYRYNEMEAAKKNMIGYSTEMGRGWGDDMYPNWPDIHGLFYDLGVTHYMDCKITYLFLYDVLPQTLYERNRIGRDPRIPEWMSLWQEILEDKTDYVANYKPIVYSSWPRPDAWWPSCSERVAVKDTSDAYGVNSTKLNNGVWVISTVDPFAKSDVTFVTLNDNPGTDYYKADYEKLLKLNDRELIMLGQRKNLGELSTDKYYTNEYFSDDKYSYQELKVPEGAEVLQEVNGRVWAMKVGKLQFIAAEPKKNQYSSLAEITKFASLPKVDESRANAKGFLEKGLGITFATMGNNAFKVVEYTLGGKDVVVLHTTKKPGGETLKFTAKKDCIFTLPYKKVYKELKAGETFTETIPLSDNENQSVGAGMGYVKIIGEKIEDLDFEGLTLDSMPQASASGYEVSALASGLLLPTPKRTNEFKYNTTEVMKAKAGFDSALTEYNDKNYAMAQQFLEEYLPLAGEDLSASFNIFLGNVSILRGKVDEAIKYYNTALERDPNNKDALCGLGCAIYNKDKEKAKDYWIKSNTEEAKKNISYLDQH